ncbi:MAG: transposase [Deltaproteobacteria bacterium]|nr:transposase [Deltaproteobacteria bacterium]
MVTKARVRKHLSADALFWTVKNSFSKIHDHRHVNSSIPLSDALMSAFAMFSLKHPSLLAFESRTKQTGDNLQAIYKIDRIPSDTQMRAILDDLAPDDLRDTYNRVFFQLQRGKALEQMKFLNGCYLLNLDGTGIYASEKLGSEACLVKKHKKKGKITYYQQMVGAAIVHPDYKEVFSIYPEMIMKQDGEKKNDCERNAIKRLLKKFREDHPKLKVIVNEDALSPNAPHIRDLQSYGCHFILAVKHGDHAYLFNEVAKANRKEQTTSYELTDEQDPEKRHLFHFINGVPLNKSNPDLLINFVEYGEEKNGKIRYFSWITDFEITEENVYQIMRGGRARWKIENETFNTLKNQGYNLGHNYGLGKKNLCAVFAAVMMLAFMVDQVQQLCCSLFRSAWKTKGSKRGLWEHIRAVFMLIQVTSMKEILENIIYGDLMSHDQLINNTS